MLVLQIVTKQWDKSQRTAAHVLERANIPNRYPIIFPPAFYEFNKQCVIDRHGDNVQGGRLKYAQLADGKIKFDRFQLSLEDKVIAYLGATQPDKASNVIGSLNNQWVQCRYADRYSIFEGGFYYWLYEEVTLNAICINEFNDNVFMDTEPALVFEDFQ
ncbi:hypothetical protein [Methylobacter tundripaludum]|uniref:Uncharacterized protein n=1 Tax=Methylobacter tundripaludum (strain ATCC BAA-1195 / DSM 17260 / SV96) TaxID=697282 RepID=G3ISR7_METTV|nr:hypothetical protein [Methylobacter tundripaludum]EGW21277.1 hypothetical protein Mettu_0035 [Methylobacter tundripaludum SV96]